MENSEDNSEISSDENAMVIDENYVEEKVKSPQKSFGNSERNEDNSTNVSEQEDIIGNDEVKEANVEDVETEDGTENAVNDTSGINEAESENEAEGGENEDEGGENEGEGGENEAEGGENEAEGGENEAESSVEEDSEEEDGEEEEDDDDDDDGSEELEGSESDEEVADGNPAMANFDSDSGDELLESCPICLNKFKGQDVGSPESCDHNFCLDCIMEWANNVNTCPVDRQVFHLVLAKHADCTEVYKKFSIEDKNTQEVEVEDFTYCEICNECNHEDRLLLCDGCDKGYHCECLTPPLDSVPIEEWFCPDCAPANQNTGGNKCPSSEEVGEGTSSELEESGIRRIHRTSPLRRQIPRTQASERVRTRIQANRAAIALIMESEDDFEQVSSSSVSPVKRVTKRKPVKRKTKTTKRKTSRKRTTKKGGKRRKTKGRRRKKKTSASSKTFSPRSLALPPAITPKARLAGRLGLSKPPTGRTIPLQKLAPERTMEGQKAASGITSLSIMGDRDELIAFQDRDENMPPAAPSYSGLPVKKSSEVGSKYSKSALKSRRPIQKPLRTEPPLQPPVASGTSKAGADLLASIFEEQAILHTKVEDVTIHRDGSLMVKKLPAQERSLTGEKEKSGKSSSESTKSKGESPYTDSDDDIREPILNADEGAKDIESTPMDRLPSPPRQWKKLPPIEIRKHTPLLRDTRRIEDSSSMKGVFERVSSPKRSPEPSPQPLPQFSPPPSPQHSSPPASPQPSSHPSSHHTSPHLSSHQASPIIDDIEPFPLSKDGYVGNTEDSVSPKTGESADLPKLGLYKGLSSGGTNKRVDPVKRKDQSHLRKARRSSAESRDSVPIDDVIVLPHKPKYQRTSDTIEVITIDDDDDNNDTGTNNSKSESQRRSSNKSERRRSGGRGEASRDRSDKYHSASDKYKNSNQGKDSGKTGQLDKRKVVVNESGGLTVRTDRSQRKVVHRKHIRQRSRSRSRERGRDMHVRDSLDKSWSKEESHRSHSTDASRRKRRHERKERSRSGSHSDQDRYDKSHKKKKKNRERMTEEGSAFNTDYVSSQSGRHSHTDSSEKKRRESREKTRHENSEQNKNIPDLRERIESRSKTDLRDRLEKRSRGDLREKLETRLRDLTDINCDDSRHVLEWENSSKQSSDAVTERSSRKSHEPLKINIVEEKVDRCTEMDFPSKASDFTVERDLTPTHSIPSPSEKKVSDAAPESLPPEPKPLPEEPLFPKKQERNNGKSHSKPQHMYDPSMPTETASPVQDERPVELNNDLLQHTESILAAQMPDTSVPPPSILGDRNVLLTGEPSILNIMPPHPNLAAMNMGLRMLPPGFPGPIHTMPPRHQLVVNPLLLNRPPPFTTITQVPGAMQRFGWPGMEPRGLLQVPTTLNEQGVVQLAGPFQTRPPLVPPHSSPVNGGLSTTLSPSQSFVSVSTRREDPRQGVVQTVSPGSKPPSQDEGIKSTRTNTKLSNSSPLNEISKLLNLQAKLVGLTKGTAHNAQSGKNSKSGVGQNEVFKVPLPRVPSGNSSRPISGNKSSTTQPSKDETEVVDMDMSPLEDEDSIMISPEFEKELKAEKNDKVSSVIFLNKPDDLPSSAVELTNKQKVGKFMKKLHLQERVVEEVKLAIKPFYAEKRISKEDYKDILRKSVPKICHSKSGDINPAKIKSLIEAYVCKCERAKQKKPNSGEKVRSKTSR